jgi:rfaE bifunctional protein kinase chain/domain
MKKLVTVMVTGQFNVLHPGHLRLFRFAKEQGDRLIVGVTSDEIAGDAAYISEQLRLDGAASNIYVDEAFIINENINKIIEQRRPDIIIKGKEHENKINPELDTIRGYGGKLMFSSGEVLFTSVDLIRQEFQTQESNKYIDKPYAYMGRHAISNQKICNIITTFSQLNVAVVGDLIIDEYITCQALGMSQEDTSIVVTPIDSSKFVGGAGIVAAHAASLGANVNFFSIAGNDKEYKFANEKLQNYGVNAHLLVDQSRPTTLKKRYRSKGKTLLRVSHLHEAAISLEYQAKLFSELHELMPSLDLLVLSDFNYGCLPQTLVEQIISLAKKSNVYIAADSQSSSQVGNIARFKGVNLITPTEYEARISTRNREDGLVVLAEQLAKEVQCETVMLKMGEEGLLIHTKTDRGDSWTTDRIEALNNNPKDTAGAGDSLLISAAMALARGATVWEAACVGSVAAAVQVGQVGNKPILAKQVLEGFK